MDPVTKTVYGAIKIRVANNIYDKLFNDEDTRQIALDTYELNKVLYMSVAQKKLMKILKL